MAGLADSAAVNAYYETEARATEYMPGAYARKGARGTRLVI